MHVPQRTQVIPSFAKCVWVNGTLKTTDGTPIADAESTAESALRQIIDVLQQVMCTHDAEKLAISVLEIYADS